MTLRTALTTGLMPLAPLLLALAACQGDRPSSSWTDDSEVDPPSPPPAPAFGMTRSAVTLLPFDVRLAKVAAVLGVETSATVLAPIRDKRLELGDYDYANGVPPDRSWSSARIGNWVRSLKPVCDSDEMRARYPKLPENLGSFIVAAYGRSASDEDTAAMADAVAGQSDPAAQYQTTCLAVLTSLEFVAR